MNRNMKRAALGVLGVALVAALLASGRKADSVAGPPAAPATARTGESPVPPAERAVTKPSDAPAFVTAARARFAEAQDLAQTDKLAARAALLPLAANDHLPAELLKDVHGLLAELSLPELAKAHQSAMRQATAALLAADDLRRADGDAADPRPWMRLHHGPLAEAVGLVRPVLAEAPEHLPAHLALALALDGQGEYGKAATAYERYAAAHANLKLPPSAELREVRRRQYVAEARAAADARLTSMVIGKWNASFAAGAAEFPPAAPASVIDLRGDGTLTGENQVRATWRVHNRQLVLSGHTPANVEWFSAGPLSPNGTAMVGVTHNANERCRYTKLP